VEHANFFKNQYIMSIAKCSNCGNAMSCGCQRRVTADGRQGCTNCINQLQAQPAPRPAQPQKN
jgi:hypothetical protein